MLWREKGEVVSGRWSVISRVRKGCKHELLISSGIIEKGEEGGGKKIERI